MGTQLGCTAREAQERVTSAEFAEWIAYQQLEPTVGERLDILFARLMCLIASIMRGKNSPTPKVQDYIPEWGGRGNRKQSVKQMATIFKAFAAVHNASLKNASR